MKCVCFVVQNYYDRDLRVRRKAEALVQAGYVVDVLALRSPNGPKDYELEGVSVRTLTLGKKRGSLLRYGFEYVAFFSWCLVQLTAEMRSKKYAFIDINTLPDFLVFASILARHMGAKIILDMHEITPEFYMSKYGMKSTSWGVRALKCQEKISFDFADYVITINEPIRNLLISRGLPQGKCTVITNSANNERFTSTSKSCIAADQSRSAATFVMMYHGTLTKLYGLDIAIEAFGIAHKEMMGAELWILGEGSESSSIKQLAEQRGLSSRVKLFGHIPPAEIPAWLAKCDVGILPIRRDVFLEFASPNKLPELILMGKAVLMSRLAAIQHYFSENALAYFEPNDPQDLARQMVRLYRDSGLRAKLAAKAKEEYAPICWDVMKRRYLNLIENIVDGHSTERSLVTEAGAF